VIRSNVLASETIAIYRTKYRDICVIYERRNIFISEVKNKSCYDITVVRRYRVDILILKDFFTRRRRKSRREFASPQSAHSSCIIVIGCFSM